MDKLKLISDLPVKESIEKEIDGLGFSAYSRILSKVAVDTLGPFTIGVFGEWGTGKTSLLRMIQSELEDNKEIITIWFNAWKYEKEKHPIIPLLHTIIREVEEHKSLLEKIEDKGTSFKNALKSIAYGLSLSSEVKVPFVGGINAELSVQDIIDQSEKLKEKHYNQKSMYYEAFEVLDDFQRKSNLKFVILIDDLDRCFPENSLKLLETIKLVLAQPGFIFFIAVARKVIEGYLQHKYESEYGIKNFKGQNYLDKMVQLPFYIPPHKSRIEEFYKMLVEQVDIEFQRDFNDIADIIGAACNNNPRATIRFVNNLLVDTSILQEITSHQLKIELGHLAICRSMQQRWPEFYDDLILFKTKEQVIELLNAHDVDEFLKDKNESFVTLAKTILEDFDLLGILMSDYGLDWLVDKDIQGITSQFQIQSNNLISADEMYIAEDTLNSDEERKPAEAFTRPMEITAELQAIVGKKPIPRTEITKRLWAYIKRNKLQDAENKRMINPDEKLAKVFGSNNPVNMFQMTKLVSKHMK